MLHEIPLFLYRSKIDRLAYERTGEPVYNDSVEHAAIILHNMFLHADRSVKILTGVLNKDAYGRRTIIDAAVRFLKDDSHEISILYENGDLSRDDTLQQHPFLRAVKSNNNKRVKLQQVPPAVQDTYGFHFVLMDDDSYRFEPDKAKLGAVAAFGDQAGGKHLQSLFSELWRRSSTSPRSTAAI